MSLILIKTPRECLIFLESFAVAYVGKWEKTSGDGAKAEGWAILQACAQLRRVIDETEKLAVRKSTP